MQKLFEKALIIAMLSTCSLAPVPANADDVEKIAALPGAGSDLVLDRALDILKESNKATKLSVRRREYRNVFDAKIVRSRHDATHTYIMGGSAAIPM